MRSFLVVLLALFFVSGVNTAYADGNGSTTKEYAFSKDSAVEKEQRAVYDVTTRYQKALNSGDVNTILSLFSDESYSQWNDKPTADTTEKRRAQYSELFANEKFETDFAYDSIHVNGNMAYVRTHHHRGATVTRIKDGATVIDLNREVFILEKQHGQWRIVVYTFNTDPIQGQS